MDDNPYKATMSRMPVALLLAALTFAGCSLLGPETYTCADVLNSTAKTNEVGIYLAEQWGQDPDARIGLGRGRSVSRAEVWAADVHESCRDWKKPADAAVDTYLPSEDGN